MIQGRVGKSVTGLLFVTLLLAVAGCGGSEARKEEARERGQELLAGRGYAKEWVEFPNALQIDPADTQARTLLGETAESLGDYEEAVKTQQEIRPSGRHPGTWSGRLKVIASTEDPAVIARSLAFAGRMGRSGAGGWPGSATVSGSHAAGNALRL